MASLPILTVNDLQLLYTVHRVHQRHQWVLPEGLIQASLLIGQNSVRLIQEKLHLSSNIGPLRKCSTQGTGVQKQEQLATYWLF